MKLSVTANSEYKKMYYYCYYAFHFFSRLRAEPHMGLMRDKIPNYRLWSNCLKGCYYYDSTKGTFISISNTNIKIRADFTNCAHICFDNQLTFCQIVLASNLHNVWKLLKVSHLNFSILAFTTNFVLLKVICLVTLFDSKFQVFKKSPKWTIFRIFNELLSTHNVNVARFSRNLLMRLFLWFSNNVIFVAIFQHFKM